MHRCLHFQTALRVREKISRRQGGGQTGCGPGLQAEAGGEAGQGGPGEGEQEAPARAGRQRQEEALRRGDDGERRGGGQVQACRVAVCSLVVSGVFTLLQSVLTHSFPTASQLFPGFFTFFYAIFKLLRPKHDFYAKFTSCST